MVATTQIESGVWIKAGNFESQREIFEKVQQYGEEQLILPLQPVVDLTRSSQRCRLCLDATVLNRLIHRATMELNKIDQLLIRWKFYKHYMQLDVSKMYWKILVHPSFQNLQHLLWRFTPDEPLVLYRHSNLIMGVVDSSAIAILCSHKATEDEKHKYPRLPDIIRKDSYADNITILSNNKNTMLQDSRDMICALERHNLDLHKFVSDDPALLREFDANLIHPDLTSTLQQIWTGSSVEQGVQDDGACMIPIALMREKYVIPHPTAKDSNLQMVVPAKNLGMRCAVDLNHAQT